METTIVDWGYNGVYIGIMEKKAFEQRAQNFIERCDKDLVGPLFVGIFFLKALLGAPDCWKLLCTGMLDVSGILQSYYREVPGNHMHLFHPRALESTPDLKAKVN